MFGTCSDFWTPAFANSFFTSTTKKDSRTYTNFGSRDTNSCGKFKRSLKRNIAKTLRFRQGKP